MVRLLRILFGNRMKLKKKILYGVATFVVMIFIAALIWSYKLCYVGLHPAQDTATFESMGYSYPQMAEWLDSIRVEGALKDTTILNEDNHKLFARWVAAPNTTNKTAFILHGYQGSSLSMLQIGYMFNKELGYNIFLPDLRAHGQSEGDVACMGWKERHEVIRWIEIADDVFGGDTQIVVQGISMGGGTTMIVAGDKNLPPMVKCAINDCGYTSVYDAFSVSWNEKLKYLKFPLFDLGNMWSRILYGWRFDDASPLNSMKECYLPLFIIHGEKDSLLPVDMAYDLFDIKPGEKELWILPGVDHGAAYLDYPQEYAQRVQAFVERWFN